MYHIGYTQPCKGIQGLGGVLFVNEGWDDVYTISRCTDKTEKKPRKAPLTICISFNLRSRMQGLRVRSKTSDRGRKTRNKGPHRTLGLCVNTPYPVELPLFYMSKYNRNCVVLSFINMKMFKTPIVFPKLPKTHFLG